ncbi:unnamed protein product [Amaranthus hypochondriacus]
MLHAIESFYGKASSDAAKEVAIALKHLYDADVLEEEATKTLGMAMVYTLFKVAKNGDVEDAANDEMAKNEINKRGDTADEKIQKLDAELARYKEQIKSVMCTLRADLLVFFPTIATALFDNNVA